MINTDEGVKTENLPTLPAAALKNSMEAPQKAKNRTSLAFHWLKLHASNASRKGQGTRIPYAMWYNKKKKKESATR